MRLSRLLWAPSGLEHEDPAGPALPLAGAGTLSMARSQGGQWSRSNCPWSLQAADARADSGFAGLGLTTPTTCCWWVQCGGLCAWRPVPVTGHRRGRRWPWYPCAHSVTGSTVLWPREDCVSFCPLEVRLGRVTGPDQWVGRSDVTCRRGRPCCPVPAPARQPRPGRLCPGSGRDGDFLSAARGPAQRRTPGFTQGLPLTVAPRHGRPSPPRQNR